MAILFVSGVNDRSLMGVNLDEKGNLVYLMDGNCSIHHRLPLREEAAYQWTLFGSGIKQRRPQFNPPPTLIFNQIADPDTHRGALERCAELCDHIGSPVVNHPRHIMQTGRERVSALLQGIPGLVAPLTVRFQPRTPADVFARIEAAGLSFPCLVRAAGEHHGRSMVRVGGPNDDAALYPLPLDGRDFYLSQYVDYRDEHGLYHKQRIIVIDGEPLLRHALYFNDWMVHANSREFMMQQDTWESDIARFDRLSHEVLPQFRPAIAEMTRRLGLEFYGIDCCMRPDGQLLVFEANANMNVLHSPNPRSRYRVEAIEQRLYALLGKYSGEQVA